MGSISEKLIKLPWIETPLIESPALSRAAGCRVFMKLENLQPSSSFKSRGIGNLVLTQIEHHRSLGSSRPLHFYASSGGNAGLAAVTAAHSLGYKSSVVVPSTTEDMIIAKLKVAGADEVIQHGKTFQDADDYLRGTVIPAAERKGEVGAYIPPFDHEAIWDGASTIVDEIRRQMPDGDKPDAIICSVGGGGLLIGITTGLDQVGWSDVKVLAVETAGAESLNASLEQGELVTLPGITSVAKSLGAVRVARKAFQEGQRKNVRSVVLHDAEACMGCWRLADDERIMVEPACGVSVAMCYDNRLDRYLQGLRRDSKVVVIVCGGSRITLDMMAEYREKYGEMAHALASPKQNGEVPSTHTAV